MDINILKNILVLFIIILLFLVLSNDKQYNYYANKQKFNYLIFDVVSMEFREWDHWLGFYKLWWNVLILI